MTEGRRMAILCFFLLMTFGRTHSLRGQAADGAVFGTVQDDRGMAVSGATVTLTATMRSRAEHVTTDDKGRFRFVNVSPGTHALRVSAAGFSAYLEEEFRIRVGENLERNISLKPDQLTEALTAATRSPGLDALQPGLSTNYGPKWLATIPLFRFGPFDFPKAAPGSSARRPSASDDDLVAAFGSGANENGYLLDGVNITSPWSGTSSAFVDLGVIQEVEVLSLGASAEYGGSPGAWFRFVTRKGGSDYRFGLSYYAQPASLASAPIELDCGCPGGRSTFARDRYGNFNVQLGGPLVEDRAWFFGGYQYLRSDESQPGADPRFPAQFETSRTFWKLDWYITPRLKLMHSYHDDYWNRPQVPTRSNPPHSLVSFEGHNHAAGFADLSYRFSENSLWSLRVSGFYSPNISAEPNNGDRSLPYRFDARRGVATGGARGFGSFKQDRTDVRVKVSYYAKEFLGLDHDFKFGVQFATGSHRGFYGYPGGVRYYDYPGFGPASGYALLREPSSNGGQFRNWGAFLEDVVSLHDRITLKLGVRFDRSTARSQAIPRIDAQGNETGGTIEGLGFLYRWSSVSPRVGFTYRLTGDGRTLLRGSVGRFHRDVLTREIEQFHPGNTAAVQAFFDPETGRYSRAMSVFDPAANLKADPDSEAPTTDQFYLGIERELKTGWVVGLHMVRKKGRKPLGWTDARGLYGTDTFHLPNGRLITVHPLLSDTGDRLFTLGNPDGWFFDYRGAVLDFQKRFSNRWQFRTSYTFSENEGLISSSKPFVQNAVDVSFADVPQRTDGAIPFGRDPNDLTNATGKLRDDRTHMVRVQGALEIPKVNLSVGLHFQYLTGKPWAAFALVPLPQGNRAVYVEPPGTRRLPSQTLLDMRLAKTLSLRDLSLLRWIGRYRPFRWAGQSRIIRGLGERGKMELSIDVFNILNDEAFEEIVTSNVFSPNFGEGRRFIDPRRAMLGVKLHF
ncbi:MAG: TonB-dependent receptor domain-containing protein [Acidobacteriota bacterium]